MAESRSVFQGQAGAGIISSLAWVGPASECSEGFRSGEVNARVCFRSDLTLESVLGVCMVYCLLTNFFVSLSTKVISVIRKVKDDN